jgi:F-type H+-transporting ATPase subunit delta
MIDNRVANRYAKSLIELAIEKGVVDQVHRDMLMFSELCQSNRDFLLMLKNPIISHDKKRKILYQVFDGKVEPSTLAIFDIITRKNRELYLPAIAEEFVAQYRTHKGITKAIVTTSFPLTDALRTRFKTLVGEQTDGKTVELVEKVDPELIGGFILKIGDRLMDNSVKHKLQSLSYEFNDDSYIKNY